VSYDSVKDVDPDGAAPTIKGWSTEGVGNRGMHIKRGAASRFLKKTRDKVKKAVADADAELLVSQFFCSLTKAWMVLMACTLQVVGTESLGRGELPEAVTASLRWFCSCADKWGSLCGAVGDLPPSGDVDRAAELLDLAAFACANSSIYINLFCASLHYDANAGGGGMEFLVLGCQLDHDGGAESDSKLEHGTLMVECGVILKHTPGRSIWLVDAHHVLHAAVANGSVASWVGSSRQTPTRGNFPMYVSAWNA
jgi:hypothetical protein